MITVSHLLVLATTQNWSLHQLDVNNTFLYRDLYEEIYVSTTKSWGESSVLPSQVIVWLEVSFLTMVWYQRC